MSKIDIAIKVTSDGAAEPFAVRGGKWMQSVIDIHPVLNNLTGLNEEGQIARILSFTDEGCILTLARLVAGRGGDNVAAWIFIPATADIKGSEVVNIVNQTEKVIASSEFNLESLRELCSKDYPEKPFFSLAPTDNKMAFRWYDSTNIDDLLGPNRYQPYYDKYRYIILLDKNGFVGLKEETDIDDLTQCLIEVPSMLLPPNADELRNHFGQDISITFANGEPFDHPVAVKKGGSIKVRFVRDGYNPVECNAKKYDDSPLTKWSLSDIKQIIWTKTIDLSIFNFTDDQGKALPTDINLIVRINGKRLGNVPVEITEPYLKQVKLDINVNGQSYEPTSLFVDLTQPFPITISLMRKTREWKHKLKMRNGEIADMTLESKNIPEGKNGPLKGYTFEWVTGDLVFDTIHVWTHRTQGFLAGLLIATLCRGISAIVNSENDNSNKGTTEHTVEKTKEQQQTFTPETGTDINSQQIIDDKDETDDSFIEQPVDDYDEEFSLEDAIAYLDKNKYWNRDEMNNYPHLNGLFDDLNNFNLDNICSHWKEELKDSKKFKDLAEWAQKVKDNGKDPAASPHAPTYNEEGDVVINRQNYINWLYNIVNPPKPRGKQPTTGKVQNNVSNPSTTKQGSGNKNF